ncbi:MAG: hypothetical protein QOF76_3258 [Solirubrobacteraceae bacterium]|nr:hypothetical protein [Solirubrobacteraceae bacterium]
MFLRVAAIVGVAVLVGVAIVVLGGGGDKNDSPVAVSPDFIPAPPSIDAKPFKDPFSYDPAHRADFEARAAAGNAHVLYALSPDGVVATAKRVNHFRAQVDAAAKSAGVDPDELEALVFLESAGRSQVIAPQGISGAVGLTQIVEETGINLLHMPIDPAASVRLTKRIGRATNITQARRLERKRRKVDPRFDPTAALAATGRYLKLAEDHFGSEELAFVSYHMGIGNLDSVLSDYAGGPTDRPLHYAQVYFDSSPTSHTTAYKRLYALGDDSANYLWKLSAARAIMQTYREDPAQLATQADAQTSKNSAEEVLHPAGTTPEYATPDDVRAAYQRGDLEALPIDTAVTGLRIDPRMGALAPKLKPKQPKALYRGLRPEALAMALYIGALVRQDSGDPTSSLDLTSTVRDDAYQQKLISVNIQATRNFSLHTTGWAFDILRRYRSPQQAQAFQSVLDRLTSLNLIAWVREPEAIHITVAADAAALKPLLARIR